MLWLSYGAAWAATLQVGPTQTYTTIGDAVAAAADGDVIEIDAGTYSEQVEIDGIGLSLVGAGSDQVTLTGSGELLKVENAVVTVSGMSLLPTSGRALQGWYATLDVTDVTVQGGDMSSDDGGGVLLEYSDAVFASCHFEDNTAELQHGGAIAALHSDLEVTGSTFVGGSAGWGGGVWVGSGTLTVSGCTFEDSEAVGTWGYDVWGGAIGSEDSDVVIEDSDFLETYCGGDGGAIGTDTGTLSVSGSSFEECESEGDGGAVYVYGSTVDLTDVAFEDDQSGYNGGALYVAEGVLDVSGTTFEDSGASASFTNGNSGYGGAAYLTASTVATFDDCSFSGNSADNAGGAVAVRSSTVTLTGTTFEDNTASQNTFNNDSGYGGALFVEDSDLDVSEAAFAGNVGEVVGGGLYLDGTGSISDSSFDSNESEYGGAVYLRGSLVLTATSFANNSATDSGGAIRWRDAALSEALEIDGCTFTDNHAGSIGGAVALYGGSSFVALGSDWTSNDAGDGGALYVYEVNEVLANQNLFCANDAITDGGATWVAVSGSTANYWTNNLFVENVAGDDGGAALQGQNAGDGTYVNNTFVGNQAADQGGAVRVVDEGVLMTNNIIAHTVNGSGVSANLSGSQFDYNDWYDNLAADLGDQLTTMGTGNVFDDPLFASWTPNRDCSDDELWLLATSTLVDAGDPSILDANGSVADIGAYGGPDAFEGPTADLDGDGFDTSSDCDDSDPKVNPDADEECDGIDNDCDGYADGPTAPGAVDWFADLDADGFGDLSNVVQDCTAPQGYVDDSTDCDDTAATVYPGADEICDGADNDCDGDVDEGVSNQGGAWYPDADDDGYGDPNGTVVVSCAAPQGYVDDLTDCDDSNPYAHPDADEVCDTADNDCDGDVDEESDQDGDGVTTCEGDCDDEEADVHPGADEDCTSDVDNNCDGVAGDVDTDGDGFRACEDCDDLDETVNPDAEEVWYDDVDGDCDGASDFDQDGDGADALDFGGEDCDDTNPDVHPLAEDPAGDGVDQDCDGGDGDGEVPELVDEKLGVGECGCAMGRGAVGWLAVCAGLTSVVRRRNASSRT